jgi:hypothetical protein
MAPRAGDGRAFALALLLAAPSAGAVAERPAADGVRLGAADAMNGPATIAADGDRVLVAWGARRDKSTDIHAAWSADGGSTFAAPARVNDVAGDARVSGEQPPRVSLGTDARVVWNSSQDGRSVLRMAEAASAGKPFAAARTLHAPGLPGPRGWASSAVGADGALHVAWLDGRGDAAPASPSPDGAHRHRAMRQDLYQAVLRREGAKEEIRIATDVCFCCKTAVATGPDGAVYVAFRHIFPPNIRDIAVARSNDGGRTFGAPVRVSEDGWAIDGCPDDGPSIAVDARNVLHVAWPTQVSPAEGKGIFYTASRDGGRTFLPRIRVDESGSAAHPQLAVAGGRVVVVWDERGGLSTSRRVRMRELATDASALPSEIQTLSDGASATYPAVAATGAFTLVAWTEETAAGSQIRVRRLDRKTSVVVLPAR